MVLSAPALLSLCCLCALLLFSDRGVSVYLSMAEKTRLQGTCLLGGAHLPSSAAGNWLVPCPVAFTTDHGSSAISLHFRSFHATLSMASVARYGIQVTHQGRSCSAARAPLPASGLRLHIHLLNLTSPWSLRVVPTFPCYFPVQGEFDLSLSTDGLLAAMLMTGLMLSAPACSQLSRHFSALRLMGAGLRWAASGPC